MTVCWEDSKMFSIFWNWSNNAYNKINRKEYSFLQFKKAKKRYWTFSKLIWLKRRIWFWIKFFLFIDRAKIWPEGGLLLHTAVLALSLVYNTFSSPKNVSGSYKNSYRKLRMYTFRSWSLVNGCWPFSWRTHPNL